MKQAEGVALGHRIGSLGWQNKGRHVVAFRIGVRSTLLARLAVRLCGVALWFLPWMLCAQGFPAAGGASLDVDDVGGEIDHARAEGRASCAPRGVSVGGGGGSARVVPGYSRRDWTAEIARSSFW